MVVLLLSQCFYLLLLLFSCYQHYSHFHYHLKDRIAIVDTHSILNSKEVKKSVIIIIIINIFFILKVRMMMLIVKLILILTVIVTLIQILMLIKCN